MLLSIWHAGQLVPDPGDETLAQFQNIVEAVSPGFTYQMTVFLGSHSRCVTFAIGTLWVAHCTDSPLAAVSWWLDSPLSIRAPAVVPSARREDRATNANGQSAGVLAMGDPAVNSPLCLLMAPYV